MRHVVVVAASLVASAQARANEPAAQPITAVTIAPATWKVGAIGVVRVTGSDAKGFAIDVVMPVQELDGLRETTTDATVASPGTLELFDARGLIGTIAVGPMRVKTWCENDGGTHARPTWNGRVERSTLKRALVPNAELQNIAAFVRIAGPAAPAQTALQRLAYQNPRVAMKGALTTKTGVVTAELLTAPDEAGNCDGEPQNNLTITLRTSRGDFSLRCCGP